MSPDSIVLGAAGFIGRSLVAELLDQGRHVAAAVRAGSAARLTDWLDERGADRTRLTVVTCDITLPDLGLPAGLDEVRDVYNSAAAFAWGLTAEAAQRVNVTGALHVLDWAASRPALRRLVHITGYRAALKDNSATGGYESSKLEADTALTARAGAAGVPLTIANPSSVIGPGQYIGLADIVADLWRGKLPALPGGRDTFVPVVTVDYFARFLASLPGRAGTAGRSYTVLDDATPNLPDLVRMLAAHLGVPAPRFQVPVGLVRRLPRALTGVEPETLTFLSDDRYDTTAADAHARAVGLRMPPVEEALREWADHLVGSRFGAVPGAEEGGFHDGMWLAGDREEPGHVLLHGVPVDGDSWAEVAGALGSRTLRADLPGLGRSAPGAGRDRSGRDRSAPQAPGTGPDRSAPQATGTGPDQSGPQAPGTGPDQSGPQAPGTGPDQSAPQATGTGPDRSGPRGSAPRTGTELAAPGRPVRRSVEGPPEWLVELMRPVRTRPVLVAHSLSCDPAIRFALAHPERISKLVLVAPAFLQARAGRLARSGLAAVLLRRMSTTRLSTVLGVPDGPAVASAVANLRRPGVARRTVAALRAASGPDRRAASRELLRQVAVPVEIIVGERDPVVGYAGWPVAVVAGAGHYPQISHPAEVARLVRGVGAGGGTAVTTVETARA
ncbi:SDR family oxidoreductase [Longispora urticae]